MVSLKLPIADGEIRRSLFLAVHGRSLYVFLSRFLFVNVRWYSLKVVGVPVNIPVKIWLVLFNFNSKPFSFIADTRDPRREKHYIYQLD